MKRNNWLLISLAIAGLAMVGCGDDDATPNDSGMTSDTTTGGDTSTADDTGTTMVNCPPSAPGPDNQMGACCSRASNADRTDSPEFRISGLDITQPASLNQPFIKSILQAALNDESFNWLISVTNAGADGTVDITTGFGRRQDDGTFSYETAGEFVPSMTTATLAGNTLMAESLAATVVVPIVDAETGEPTITLPLQELTLSMATWDADRTCIGNVAANGMAFDTTQASLTAHITVEDANNADVTALSNTLCNLLRGMNADGTAAQGDCTMQDQAGWGNKPDALCDDTGCSTECDADTTCNAWVLSGGFAAQGVEIN